jgi:hypothetical protein
MLAGFEHLKQSDDVRMLDFLEQVHFLEDLPFTKVILHIILFNCFDSHLFTCKFVNTQGNFSKRSFTDQLYKLIEVKSGWG